MNRRVANCSERTLATYQAALQRFQQSDHDLKPLGIQQHLTALREQVSPITAHQHFRVLRTFCRWCVEAGLVAESPMRGISMRAPKTLPKVPEDEMVRRLMAACDTSHEGRRNRALVSLLADSG
ncbi:MAG TPA: hypothetical protein VJT32_13060, partial [bacterium]|nr:hypothetical protein [bacterium]